MKKQINIPAAALAKMTSQQAYCIRTNSDRWNDDWVESLQKDAPYLVPRVKDLTNTWKKIRSDIFDGILDAHEGLLKFHNYFYDTWQESNQTQQILKTEYKNSQKE